MTERQVFFILRREKSPVFLFLPLFLLLLGGCAGEGASFSPLSGGSHQPAAPDTREETGYAFSRKMSDVDFSRLAFTPWEAPPMTEEAREPVRPYTIFIYLNGSDLESEDGAATEDLREMLRAAANTAHVNIILFSGGTNRWRNDVIPADECVLWRIADGGLERLAGVGLRNMGDAGTLASFIQFGMDRYPAEKYGLILWDHGGGSIAGYGQDEQFENGRLTLLELDYAFSRAGLSEQKLEFLGLDACLMATVELAVVASSYARYLIASEDLEPGDGWDYSFFADLSAAPQMDGAALGKIIADSYMDYYARTGEDSPLTLSVTELSSVGRVMGAMGRLMDRCAQSMERDQEAAFLRFAGRRYFTKSFGLDSRMDTACDMVDLRDMALMLRDLYPEETAALLSALERSVVYNRHNARISLGGLAAFYLFAGKNDAEYTLKTYASLGMSKEYTDYLFDFAARLTKGGEPGAASPITGGGRRGAEADRPLTAWDPLPGGGYYLSGLSTAALPAKNPAAAGAALLWPSVEGEFVCMRQVAEWRTGCAYAVSASVGGEEAELIIVVTEQDPAGRILGYRKEEGFLIQKGVDPIRDGDRIAFYYQTAPDGGGEEWHRGREITVRGAPRLSWQRRGGETQYSFCLTDARQNARYPQLSSAAGQPSP